MTNGRKNSLEFSVGLAGDGDVGSALRKIGEQGRRAFDDLQKAGRDFNAAGERIGDTTEKLRQDFRQLQEEARRVRAQLDNVAKAESGLRTLGSTVGRLAGLFAGIFAARSLASAADTMTEIGDRIRLAIGEGDDFNAVLTQLGRTANATGQGLEVVAEGFLNQATSLKELGLSTQQALDFTESLTLALTVSGLRGEKAASVQEALSRAMALGELRGQNLNTVLQNGGRIAEILAKHLNVTTNQLRSLGAQGQINSKVIVDAFSGSLAQLQADADAMAFTIQDSVTILRNSFLQYVGSADQATGASRLISEAIRGIARNLDIVIPAIGLFLAAWGAAQLIQILGTLRAAGQALLTIALGLNLASLPLLLFLASIVALGGGLAHVNGWLDPIYEKLGLMSEGAEAAAGGTDRLRAAAGEAAAGLQTLGADAAGAAETAGAAMEAAADRSESAWSTAIAAVDGMFDGLDSAATRIITAIVKGLEQVIALAKRAYDAIRKAGGKAEGGPAGFAAGGPVRGPGTSTSDSIPAWLSAGEFVMRARAVRDNGAAVMAAINAGALNVRDLLRGLSGFAGGGLVPGLAPAIAGGAAGLGGGGRSGTGLRPVTVSFEGQSWPVLAEDDVAEAMVRHATRAAARRAGRMPSWHRG